MQQSQVSMPVQQNIYIHHHHHHYNDQYHHEPDRFEMEKRRHDNMMLHNDSNQYHRMQKKKQKAKEKILFDNKNVNNNNKLKTKVKTEIKIRRQQKVQSKTKNNNNNNNKNNLKNMIDLTNIDSNDHDQSVRARGSQLHVNRASDGNDGNDGNGRRRDNGSNSDRNSNINFVGKQYQAPKVIVKKIIQFNEDEIPIHSVIVCCPKSGQQSGTIYGTSKKSILHGICQLQRNGCCNSKSHDFDPNDACERDSYRVD